MLEHGAAVNVQAGHDRSTPLHLAVEDGGAESARLLLEAGADLTSVNRKMQTPLHLAALSQSIESVELLLNKGADPNASDADGRTPLHCAIVKVNETHLAKFSFEVHIKFYYRFHALVNALSSF